MTGLHIISVGRPGTTFRASGLLSGRSFHELAPLANGGSSPSARPVRKIPTHFIDISGIDRRCSSYFHPFYNSTQFANDQERAA
jgi:hypothetical protein